MCKRPAMLAQASPVGIIVALGDKMWRMSNDPSDGCELGAC